MKILSVVLRSSLSGLSINFVVIMLNIQRVYAVGWLISTRLTDHSVALEADTVASDMISNASPGIP